MHVVVVGCGRVGSQLSARLEQAGHSVGVIDRRAEAFVRLAPRFRGRKVVGVGFDRDHLVAAGIEEAGALAAVTSGDNSNILSARIARETFGVERVVARIYDPERAEIYARLGVNTVPTVSWATDQTLRRLLPDENRQDWSDPTGSVVLVERALPVSLVGRRVAELEQETAVRVMVVQRAGVGLIPSKDLLCQEGDVLNIAVMAELASELDRRFSTTGPAT